MEHNMEIYDWITYICIYVSHICIYIHCTVCIYIRMYIRKYMTGSYICAYMYRIYVYILYCIYTHVCIHIHTYIYTHIYVCVCVCIYIYMYYTVIKKRKWGRPSRGKVYLGCQTFVCKIKF